RRHPPRPERGCRRRRRRASRRAPRARARSTRRSRGGAQRFALVFFAARRRAAAGRADDAAFLAADLTPTVRTTWRAGAAFRRVGAFAAGEALGLARRGDTRR